MPPRLFTIYVDNPNDQLCENVVVHAICEITQAKDETAGATKGVFFSFCYFQPYFYFSSPKERKEY